MNTNPMKNAEGYCDPTAFFGTLPVVKEDARKDAIVRNCAKKLISTLKAVAEMAGFEIVGRVAVKHTRTGKEFR